MVRVSCKYNAAFVEFLKSIGGRWSAEGKFWGVSDSRRAEVEAKAKELGVSAIKIEPEKVQEKAQPMEGAIKMRLSKDGRFVLVSVNMLAFTEDVKALLDGKRKSVRFRVLPPRR